MNDVLRAVFKLPYRLDDKPAYAYQGQGTRQDQRQGEKPYDPVCEWPHLMADLLHRDHRAYLPAELWRSVIEQIAARALLLECGIARRFVHDSLEMIQAGLVVPFKAHLLVVAGQYHAVVIQ